MKATHQVKFRRKFRIFEQSIEDGSREPKAMKEDNGSFPNVAVGIGVELQTITGRNKLDDLTSHRDRRKQGTNVESLKALGPAFISIRCTCGCKALRTSTDFHSNLQAKEPLKRPEIKVR